MRFKQALIIGLLGAALAGCSSANSGGLSAWTADFRDSSSMTNSEAGTAIEVLLSNELGASLERSDRKQITVAQEKALLARADGAVIPWQNDKTGHTGSVATGPYYQVNDQVCRELTYNMLIDNRPISARGAACRAEKDEWRIIG
ncbi:MAG: hypothetical protein HWE23_04270 [Rhodobacteraceae bacterium]|nr:hypothetical protein [Paracoccaceae bacterium]